MPGRKYRTIAVFTSQTAQVDLFEIVCAATKVLRILEVHVSQSSDVKDAEEEMLVIHLKSGSTTSGSGGNTSVAAVPASKGDPAASATIETHNTTKATAGTIVTHLSVAWNVRVPLDIIFTPETVIELPPSERFTVELGTTPGDAITLGGYVVFEELG